MTKPEDHDPSHDDYRVGRNRPPRHTQFKKGGSGNPAGRPKRGVSVHDQVAKLLARKIPVPENGVLRTRTVQETMLLAIANKGLKGDIRAAAFLLNLLEMGSSQRSKIIDPAALGAFDSATLRHYLQNVIDGEAEATAPLETKNPTFA